MTALLRNTASFVEVAYQETNVTTLTPDVISATGAASAPTVAATILLTVPVISATGTVVSPSVLIGGVNLAANTASATAVALVPTLSPGVVVFTSPVISATATITAPDILTPHIRVTAEFIEVIYHVGHNEVVSSTINFSQNLARSVIDLEPIVHTLDLSQGLWRSEYPGSLLQLTQSVSLDIILTKSVSSALSLVELALANFRKSYAVLQTLDFSSSATWTRVIPTSAASNSLSLSQAVDASRPVRSLLVFNQTVTAVVHILGGRVSNALVLNQSVVVKIIDKESVTSNLALNQLATVNIVDLESASNDLELRQEALFAFVRHYMMLQAPWGAIEQTVTLPSPELQDAENLVDTITINYAEDGTLYTYVKSQKERRLNYTFSLTRQKSLELQSFIDAWNSDAWKMLNWKGEIWKVKLVTNPIEFVPARRGAPCGPTTEVSFTLEGEKIL